jgi:polar amino acid transport system substrate-binding protein
MSSIRTRSASRVALGAGLLSVALLGAACSSSGGSTTTTTIKKNYKPVAPIPAQTKDAAIAALVPASVASTGTITYAMDASYPPDEFTVPGSSEIVGMDADLGKAMAQLMGLTPKLENVTFDAIIPGLQAGKYDVGLSSFTDTLARQKVVDFADYFQAGEAFYVMSSSTKSYSSLASLCGATVAVESGTVEETDAKTQSKACTSKGKDAVTVQSFSDQNGVNLAVSSGRADVGFADSQVAGYVVSQSSGAFKLTGQAFNVAPYGIATPKGNGMVNAVAAAVQKLIDNGTYTKILKKWGTESGAITKVTINGATS